MALVLVAGSSFGTGMAVCSGVVNVADHVQPIIVKPHGVVHLSLSGMD